MTTVRSEARLQHSLAEIVRLLERHRVLESMTQRQEGPRRDLIENLQHRQNLAELHKRLRGLHVADVAYVLEALPLDDRGTVWDGVSRDRAGDVFIEVSPAVRDSLVALTPRDQLVGMLAALDPEDLAYVSESLPEDVLNELSRALESADRSELEDSIQYGSDAVGRYMTRELVAVPESQTVRATAGRGSASTW
jgi:magnesium transporter